MSKKEEGIKEIIESVKSLKDEDGFVFMRISKEDDGMRLQMFTEVSEYEAYIFIKAIISNQKEPSFKHRLKTALETDDDDDQISRLTKH